MTQLVMSSPTSTAEIDARDCPLGEGSDASYEARQKGQASSVTRLFVNGRMYELVVAPHARLSDVLRDQLHLQGVRVSCEEGECGSCSILVDGSPVTSCLMLANQAEGKEITTIEGLGSQDVVHPIQEAFIEEQGFQCGVCTPGLVMVTKALLDKNAVPTRADVVEAVSGNICRCGAYPYIVRSALRAAQKLRDRSDNSLSSDSEADESELVTSQLAYERDYQRPGLAVVSKGVIVKDAVEKVTGTLKYAVDVAVPGMLYGKILRSPHAHAVITRIDMTRALAHPGVIAAVSHLDAPAFNWQAPSQNYRGHIFDGIVRFVGDEVAAVAAVDEDAAEAALDLIDVEYEILPPVLDLEEAMTPSAPQVRVEGNVRPAGIVEWGSVAEGERESAFTVDCHITFSSQQHAPLGRNACIAEWSGDHVTVRTSSQTPSELRDAVHQAFGVPLSKIRAIALPVGCSFGQWWVNNFMLITALLARKARMPVKIELTNEECMGAVKRRHVEIIRGRMGCDASGRLTFMDFDRILDNGAYGYRGEAGISCADMWGRSKHGHIAMHGVNTNRVTAGCMRGVAEVTLGSCIERLADKLAEKTGMDPVAFRLMNQIQVGEELRRQPARQHMKGSVEHYVKNIPDDLKADWPDPFRLSSGSTHEILAKGAAEIGWKDKWRGWGRPYRVDGSRHYGVGVGTGAHACGSEAGGNNSAVVRLNADGSVSLFCSVGRQGQGSETTLAQIAAETLGVKFEDIDVETGDTDSCPWGHGSLASNTLYRAGYATKMACEDAKNQLLAIAAREFFSGDSSDLDVVEGHVQCRGDRQYRQVSIRDILSVFRSDSLGPTSSITGRSEKPMPPPSTYARHFAAHFADVEVDTETGCIQLLDYVAAQDSGTVVNPQVFKNQVVGGAICGAGFALHEAVAFDPVTGVVRNPNLLDYKVMRAADFPSHVRVIFSESYDPVGPFGAKGGGEAPVAAADAAIAQAVYNAIGVWVDMPMTSERVLTALGKVKEGQ